MLEVAQTGLHCRNSRHLVVVAAARSVQRSSVAGHILPFAVVLHAVVGTGIPFGGLAFAAEALKPWAVDSAQSSRRSLSSPEPDLLPLVLLELTVMQASDQAMLCWLRLCSKKASKIHLQALMPHCLYSFFPSSHLAVPDTAAC